MKFNSIGRQGNYSQAGKAVADDALNSFLVARRKSPEYGKIAQDAANIAREKKINSIKAQSAVTDTGIAAAAGVKTNKIKTEAESNYKSAKRKAGVLAAGGQMISEAGQYIGNKRERREIGDGDSYFDNEIETNNKKIEDLRSKIKPFEPSGGKGSDRWRRPAVPTSATRFSSAAARGALAASSWMGTAPTLSMANVSVVMSSRRPKPQQLVKRVARMMSNQNRKQNTFCRLLHYAQSL